MGDLASTCKDKLAYFRIKELKDVLIHLALPKHGKKQDLVDRILTLVSDDQGQWHFGRGKKNVPSKETVAGVVDDIYRKMQVHGPPDLFPQRQVAPDFSFLKHQKEQEQPCHLGANNSRCVCGQTFLLGNLVKCEDCQGQQHVDCVQIPEKPTGRPEVPAHFYCQLCRLKRADPYWVTTGNPLPPMRLMFSNVANDGTNVSQSVDKTFLLSRAEWEIVQRAEYDIQVWCMLLNDKVQFRMHWPQHAELQVNGIPVRVVLRPNSQLLGINGRDDGPVITTFCQEGQNKILLTCVDARPFCIGIRIARKRTVEQVLNLVPKEADGESFEEALARVCRCLRGGNTTDDADSDSDLEVVADFFPVSLRCPNSGSRIRTAGRFKPCVHMGSFDLQTFVELNQRSRKWQCPTCLKNYSIESMIIDRYFNRITSLVQNCSEDVTDIDVKPDGSWRVKGVVEDTKLSQWHLPDGSLCNLKQDTKPVAGDANQFKKGASYDGSESSKIGSKGYLDLNGLWEISKGDDIKPSIPMSSSHTGICRDGEYQSVSECSTHFGLSSINGHDLDGFPDKFGPLYRDDVRPQEQLMDADVIVLSDSDEENVATASPPAAYNDGGGLGFTLGVAENYQEGGAVGGSGLGLFNHNSDIFDINSWSQPEQGFHLFGADTLVDSRNSSDAAPNAYTLDCNAGSSDTSMVQDLSTYRARTISFVDNLLPFEDDDSSLRIFLPSQPSSVPLQEVRNERDNMSNGVQPDDWISLTLAAGGGGTEQSEPAVTVNPQPQIPVKERSVEPSSDAAASSFLSLNDDDPRAASIFCHPRQPRSVRPRLRLSIPTDSE
ncbi:E3 SUMO-protein ligase SIZ1 isoform X1 [Lolium perenne]|uniref:E3 SUMO-protein ligase SIZ1 isoform X1 n=1 Tax=Lolium perenne TaxID=4522 RepID=UPI0021F5A283|nr:E3 SUMO-protein ligase SIZ1-like isoform X1 [Lolium perenne]